MLEFISLYNCAFPLIHAILTNFLITFRNSTPKSNVRKTIFILQIVSIFSPQHK